MESCSHRPTRVTAPLILILFGMAISVLAILDALVGDFFDSHGGRWPWFIMGCADFVALLFFLVLELRTAFLTNLILQWNDRLIFLKSRAGYTRKRQSSLVSALLPFPAALAICACFCFILWPLARAGSAAVAGYAAVVISAVILIAAIILRYRPGVGRNTAYALVFAAVGLFWTTEGSDIGHIPLTSVTGSSHDFLDPVQVQLERLVSMVFPAAHAPVVLPVAVLGVLALINMAMYFRRSPAVSPKHRRFLRATSRAISIIGPFLAVLCAFVFFNHVIFTYFLVRFLVLERLRRIPLVYLRSFSHGDGPRVLGHIIIPAVKAFGHIAALTHPTQPPSSMRMIDLQVRSLQFDVAAEDRWKEWVVEHLNACWAVVIDRTLETAGVSWEMTEAQKIVPAHRIVVLRPHRQRGDDPAACHVIYYGLTPALIRRAQEELRAILSKIDCSDSATEETQ